MIRFDNLMKAQQIFENFRQDMVTDRDKAGAIQAFEFCYELSWKAMKRALNSLGQESASPKDTFRKAAKEKIIQDPEIWFEFMRMRNLSSHTYREQNIEAIIGIFDSFSTELNALLMVVNRLEL